MTTTTTTKKKKKQTKTTTTTTTPTTKKTRKKKKESSSSSSFLRRQIILPISDVFVAIRSMNVRQLTLQLLSLTLIVTSALMIWKSLCLYTHSESPVVVVLSGSMEPAFKRGDILFLSLKKIKEEDIEDEERKTRVGEIIVFSIDGREIPIVHRVIKSHFHPFVSPPSSSSSSFSSSSLPTTIKTTKKESGENEKDQGRGGNTGGEDGLSSTRSDGSGSSEIRKCENVVIKNSCSHKTLINISGTEFRNCLKNKKYFKYADYNLQKFIFGLKQKIFIN